MGLANTLSRCLESCVAMKLLGHSQNSSIHNAMPLIRRLKPEYWKAIDPPADVAKECQAMHVNLIVRHYGPWDNDWNAFNPASFVEDCKQQAWWPYAAAIESPNEPHPGTADKMQELVRLLEAENKDCVVGNWGTGWSGFYVPGATYYASHEYGFPNILDQKPWQALRYRDWFHHILMKNPNAKLFITECGVTQAVTGGQDIGWSSDGRSAEDYWRYSLLPYDAEIEKDPYVLKAFVYQFGGNPDWSTFECVGTAIEDLLAQSMIVEDTMNAAQKKELNELAGIAWGLKEMYQEKAAVSKKKNIPDSESEFIAALMEGFVNRLGSVQNLT